MVSNGDFSQGTSPWIWTVATNASAQWRVTNGIGNADIINGGPALASIRLRQPGITLIQGKKYVFEFDAWSQAPRYIEAKIAQLASPYANYSGIGFASLTPTPTHYRYEFTMQQASDSSANVMFNLGSSAFDVFLDNVSLFNVPEGDFNSDGKVGFKDLEIFSADWLKAQTGLIPDLDGNGKVDFKDFVIFGANWSDVTP